jgi:SAM-dependent methyltransferase
MIHDAPTVCRSSGALARLGIAAADADGSLTATQHQTREAFGFKWEQRHTYESPAVQAATRAWLVERYLGGDITRLDHWLAGGGRCIVDAGCGAGNSALALLRDHLASNAYLGVDISSAVRVARQRFAEADVPGDFLQASLFDAPIPEASADLVIAEGVLHHTDSTEQAFHHVARWVKPGGRLGCYVYARKAPVREFTDDLVRDALRPLDDAAAWRALEPLTKLGHTLGALEVTVDVPEAIPFLGIPAGPIDLQRLFYWYVCKMYYRPEYSLEEMQHVNFDWFRPLNCHRHTPEEVRRWCSGAGLVEEHLDVQPSGITLVARRPSV